MREKDSLVRPGYIHPKYRAFPVVTEFSGDLLCEKKIKWAQCRIELTSFGLLILTYTPRPKLPSIREHKILNIKTSSDISSMEKCKIPS